MFSQKLIDARLSFRAWITEDIAAKVMPFEAALRKMGAHKIGLEGIPPGPERTRLVTEIYKLFSDVTGIEGSGPVDENLAAGRIMSHLQDLLGVQPLSRLRQAVVQAAIDNTDMSWPVTLAGCQGYVNPTPDIAKKEKWRSPSTNHSD